jgi:hypothetical protein
MKAALAILLLATSAFGQTHPASLPPACGPAHVSFDAEEQSDRPTPPPPEPGKAQVFFIQDDGPGGDDQHYTIKIGLDGAWTGAYKHNSYFTLSAEPGEHHVCANVQSNLAAGQIVALAHFTAEAGKVYYFRTRLIFSLAASDFYLDLSQTDSDEAKYLISSYPLSTWKAKK